MNKIIVFIFLIAFQSIIYAQKDSLRINGEIGIRGKWQTGNFAQFVINPNVGLVLKKKKTRIELRSNYEFLKVNHGSLINDFWSVAMVQYNSAKTIFPMTTVHYGFAQSYAIDRSFIGGIGVGFNLIKKNKHHYLQANVFTGYMNLKYENESAHNASNIGSYIKLKFPLKEDLIYFLLDMHAYISLHSTDYRGFNNRIVLHFQTFKNLGVNISHRLVHNNNTPIAINKINGKLVFGLNYTFN